MQASIKPGTGLRKCRFSRLYVYRPRVETMRISFNPSVMNMKPVQPIHRVVRQDRSLLADPVDSEPVSNASVSTSLSPLLVQKSKEDVTNEGQYKKNPLWNAMLNLP
jgi:hypothetical protein